MEQDKQTTTTSPEQGNVTTNPNLIGVDLSTVDDNFFTPTGRVNVPFCQPPRENPAEFNRGEPTVENTERMRQREILAAGGPGPYKEMQRMQIIQMVPTYNGNNEKIDVSVWLNLMAKALTQGWVPPQERYHYVALHVEGIAAKWFATVARGIKHDWDHFM